MSYNKIFPEAHIWQAIEADFAFLAYIIYFFTKEYPRHVNLLHISR